MKDPRTTPAGVDRALLDRVRALLNKAESTPFEAEAASFTAKAHELMTRHAIDAAMLVDSTAMATRLGVSSVDIAIVEPYVNSKSLLLHVVATANRCRSVLLAGRGRATVFGFPADLAATELLYTSLLLQAQSALTEASRHTPAGSPQRSRSYRSSFLLAYAHRIGDRLEEVGRRVVAEAEAQTGRSVLPVLRDREALVEEAMRAQFANLSRGRARSITNLAGWEGGMQAADRADLAFGRLAG